MKICHVNREFGDTLVCSVLYPYFLKQEGWQVDVLSKIALPGEITKSFSDSYTLIDTRAHSCKGSDCINDKRSIMNLAMEGDSMRVPLQFIKSVPLPPLPQTVTDPYVVILPTIYNWWGNDSLCRLYGSMPLEGWTRIAERAREMGYKVICFGTEQGCSKEHAEKIGDSAYWFSEDSLRKSNTIFVTQLALMQHAKTSIAIAGAAAPFFVFDVPGLGVDGAWYHDYASFYGIIAAKRRNLQLLPDFSYVLASWGLNTQASVGAAQNFVCETYLDALGLLGPVDALRAGTEQTL